MRSGRGEIAILAIVMWLVGVGVILLIGQWPRIVRANWQLEGWPLIDEVAILLPVVAPLFLIWAALYRVERSAQLADCAAQNIEPPRSRLIEYVALQARHHLALILLPPLVIVGLIEAVAALKITSQFGLVWWFVVPQVAVGCRCRWLCSECGGRGLGGATATTNAR